MGEGRGHTGEILSPDHAASSSHLRIPNVVTAADSLSPCEVATTGFGDWDRDVPTAVRQDWLDFPVFFPGPGPRCPWQGLQGNLALFEMWREEALWV